MYPTLKPVKLKVFEKVFIKIRQSRLLDRFSVLDPGYDAPEKKPYASSDISVTPLFLHSS